MDADVLDQCVKHHSCQVEDAAVTYNPSSTCLRAASSNSPTPNYMQSAILPVLEGLDIAGM